MNNPKYIIVHHAGGTDSNPNQDSSNYTVEMCNQDHKQRFNFISSLGYYVGYQYFIDKYGVITQTRSDTEEGAHTIGKNKESIGICLAGNFDITLPTEAQKLTLKSTIREKIAQYNIPVENVLPHRAFAHKSCYGTLLEDAWAQNLIKEEVKLEVQPVIEIPKKLSFITIIYMKTKDYLVSFINTFLATFLTVIVTAFSTIPIDALLTMDVWKTSVIAGILVGAVRAGVKAVLPSVLEYIKSVITNLFK